MNNKLTDRSTPQNSSTLGFTAITPIMYLYNLPMRKSHENSECQWEALRMAQDDLVLVMNRNEPDALMIGHKSSNIIGMPGVRKALARSAKLADMFLANFIAHVSRLGISVINQSAEEVQQDMDTLDQWLKEA
ncbi:MAG: hypothetical protein NTV43_14085 [Methylococcales bacterium]|nr:hypothetical protein [Methylococcales bacterium]